MVEKKVYFELEFPHVVLACEVLVFHPEALEQVHEAMLKEYNIQEINDIGTEVADEPGIGILFGLEGESRTQRDDPGIVEEGDRDNAQPRDVDFALRIQGLFIVITAAKARAKPLVRPWCIGFEQPVGFFRGLQRIRGCFQSLRTGGG